MGFNEAHHCGKRVEKAIADAFLADGWTVRMGDERSRWDISASKDDVTETIEIKNEENFATSGRVCIEMLQGSPPRPSGIMASESTFYVHYFGQTSMVFRTQHLRLFLDGIRGTEKLIPFKGSDNANHGYVMGRVRFSGQPWAREIASADVPKAVFNMRRQSAA